MCEDNNTRVTEVVFHGFQNLNNYNIVFFCVLLLIFLVILVGNVLIITLISLIPLRHPMYFFLKHLSIVDVLFTTNIVPALLHVILWGQGHLSITGCIFHYYVHSFLAFIQSFLLTVMAYDRYVAICDPLHYSTLITTKTCYYLVCSSWILSYILISSEIIFIYQLQFCKTNYIDHFFCDIAPILQISSSDTFIIIWIDFVICFLTIFFPFLLVIGSYICIFINILKMSSVVRKKTFSTCSSHLLIVCLYYGTLTAIYAVPSGDNSHNENKFKSLIYTVLTPFINPIIYSLRNQEIIERMRKLIGQHIWARN